MATGKNRYHLGTPILTQSKLELSLRLWYFESSLQNQGANSNKRKVMAIRSFRFPNGTPLVTLSAQGCPLGAPQQEQILGYRQKALFICSCLVQEWQSYLKREESYGHSKKMVPSWYPPLNSVKIGAISPIRVSFESSLHLLSGHRRISFLVRTRRKLWPSEISDFPMVPPWSHSVHKGTPLAHRSKSKSQDTVRKPSLFVTVWYKSGSHT